MKVVEVPFVVTSLLGLCLLADPQVPAARADFTSGPRVNLGPTINSAEIDACAVFSPDGLELYFASNRPLGYGDLDIWMSKRASVNDPWGPPVNLGPGINSGVTELPSSISSDGLTLYLSAIKGTMYDLYTATRPARDAPWGPRVSMGPVLNGPDGGSDPRNGADLSAVISPDDLELFYTSFRPGNIGLMDILVSTRATPSDPWGPPVNLGPAVNTPGRDLVGCISPDGLTLFIGADSRPGGRGGLDVYMTCRPYKGAAWSEPVNLGPSFNTAGGETCSISPDGQWAYGYDAGNQAWPVPGADLWMAPIIPIVDFNGDGKVDTKDFALLVADWGKSNSVCDIGPFAWGDGIVDTCDLSVLLKEMTGSGIALNPCSDASEVACDAILSWTSVSFAQSYDVYLGTSQETVSTASRANPQGVLVSQGQTVTAYDPPGLLELSQTYYWRVDFVTADPAPAITKGPVLEFTTAGLTYPIKNITVTASSAQAGSGPERTVDGSGLDKNGGHSTDVKAMWSSMMVPPHWIQYEFDKVYTLHEMWVWNLNTTVEPVVGFGAKTVKIEYSTDGAAWTVLANVPEFARAPGKAGYTANTIVSFAAVPARFVKLTIETNWGSKAPQTGLSEVRFFCIQTAGAPKP